MSANNQLLLSIVDFLYNQKEQSGNSADVEESIRLLQQAFNINKDDMMFRCQYAIDTDLATVFNSYMKSHPAPPANTLASPLSNPELKTFLMNLQSRGYFADVNPSSEEYRQRYEKAVAKYLERKGHAVSSDIPVNTEMVSQCESIKEQGNAFFRRGEFKNAMDSYTEAIEMYNENPNKYVYLCNRATAAFYLSEYEMAEQDCKECIALNAKHIKAYTRLAAVYQKLNRDEDAMHVCEDGLKVDNSNAELTAILNRLKAKNSGQSSGGMNFADLMNSMASNPSVREAAQNIANGNMGSLSDLLNNPAISQMANNIMSNPEMMNNLMSLGNMFANGGNNGNQGGFNMDNLANLMRGAQQFMNQNNNDNQEEDNNQEESHSFVC